MSDIMKTLEGMAEGERDEPVPETHVRERVLASMRTRRRASSMQPFAWISLLSGVAAAVLVAWGLFLQVDPVEQIDVFNVQEAELALYDVRD